MPSDVRIQNCMFLHFDTTGHQLRYCQLRVILKSMPRTEKRNCGIVRFLHSGTFLKLHCGIVRIIHRWIVRLLHRGIVKP